MLGEGLLTPPLRFPIYRDPDTQTFLETYGQTRAQGQETLAQRGGRSINVQYPMCNLKIEIAFRNPSLPPTDHARALSVPVELLLPARRLSPTPMLEPNRA